MEINPKIIEEIASCQINVAEGLAYLLLLHCNCVPTHISEHTKEVLIQRSKILTINNSGKVHFIIPLFINEANTTPFDWVKEEYVAMFKEANAKRGTNAREATSRMKKLFATYPDIRKDEILGATRMYLNNTDHNYIMCPHYFIQKGIGSNKTETILDWIDKYRFSENVKGNSVTNTLQ